MTKKNLLVPEEYKEDLFHWIINQRLEKFPNMPIVGFFPLSEVGGEDIMYGNEREYIALVKKLEEQYPEFKFEKKVLEYVSLDGVNHPYETIFKNR